MTETVRVFVAIELPTEVKDTLSNLIAQLRVTGNSAIRLVRPEGIHLTLKFLGDVPKTKVSSIISALTEAVRTYEPFELELANVGAFPNHDRPRVLWAGVDGDMQSLNILQRKVDDALSHVGFDKEKRGFNPHLTLARIRERSPNADRQKAMNTLLSTNVERGLKIPVKSISLMRSTLRPDGAIYDSLASMPLLRDSRSPKRE